MSNTNLSELASQKLRQIHDLVLQFQALETDLRDTFQSIEENHQNEIKKLQTEINQFKGVPQEEIHRNQFFGASQLEANPLSQQQNSSNNYNKHQQRQPNGSIFNQPPPPINPSQNNNYSPYTQQQQQQHTTQQQQQQHTTQQQNSNQNKNHWKAKTPMSYQQNQQNQNSNGYPQQNSYHSKQNRSTGNPVPPPPNQLQNQLQQKASYAAYSTNKKSLPPSPKIEESKKERAKNPVASLMNKFTNKNKDKNNNNNNDDGGLQLIASSGISERDFYKKYWIEAGKIGEGAFARVRKITRKSDKAVFALKMIKKKGKSAEDIVALQREILVLQKCDHVNIVRLGDWCDTKKRIYMVVEFCDGGDVFERVVQYKKFSEKSAVHVVQQVSSGIGHVHSLGYVHRDLKPDNLMYLTKDIDSEIKVIDFGLAGDCNQKPCSTPCGTAHYAAPEVLSSQEYHQSADMWSLGVIIYTLLCGFPPFFDASNNMKNLYHLIKKGQYSFPSPFWDDISDNAKDLIQKLLVKDPSKRLTANQVLKHPWIDNAKSAPEKDLGNQYVKQMSHWQSTRQATEFGLGQEAPPPPPPDQPINLYYNTNDSTK